MGRLHKNLQTSIWYVHGTEALEHYLQADRSVGMRELFDDPELRASERWANEMGNSQQAYSNFLVSTLLSLGLWEANTRNSEAMRREDLVVLQIYLQQLRGIRASADTRDRILKAIRNYRIWYADNSWIDVPPSAELSDEENRWLALLRVASHGSSFTYSAVNEGGLDPSVTSWASRGLRDIIKWMRPKLHGLDAPPWARGIRALHQSTHITVRWIALYMEDVLGLEVFGGRRAS